jgi:thiol-disulfide isomerase/thioredoxin
MSTTEPVTTSPTSRWRRVKRAYEARPSLRWAVDLTFVVAVFAGVSLWQTRAHLSGGPLPAFSLKALDGSAWSSSSLSGKPTLLAFWAPWCGVCKTESRNLGWARRLVGARANVVSVASAFRSEGDVSQYVTEQGVDYPVLLDDQGLAETMQVAAYPTVYFVDERGHIKGSVVGYTTTLGLALRTLW